MIIKFTKKDLNMIMEIWLDTNIKTHSFIPKNYWINNFEMVKKALLDAEIYVFENDVSNQIDGFIGLTDNFIEGIFVKESAQSHGVGKRLLDYVKSFKPSLYLSVYKKI